MSFFRPQCCGKEVELFRRSKSTDNTMLKKSRADRKKLHVVIRKKVCIPASRYKLVRDIYSCLLQKSFCTVCHFVAHPENLAISTLYADYNRKTQ